MSLAISPKPDLKFSRGINWRSCYSVDSSEHLAGFTPISFHVIENKEPFRYSKFGTWRDYLPPKRIRGNFVTLYLLLEKHGDLYVDVYDGRDYGRKYWGINPNSEKLEEVLLPSEVFDNFWSIKRLTHEKACNYS